MKRYAIVSNGTVVNVAVSDAPLSADWIETQEAQIGWTWDGEQFSPPTPVPRPPEEVRDEIEEETQRRLDDFAGTRGYDNIVSACSYATSTHPKYGVEGRYCVTAREETWDAVFAIEADVLAGLRPLPAGYAEIEPELPPLVWPL
jgi:hypothetical protein